MNAAEFLLKMRSGSKVECGSEECEQMCVLAQQAMKITAELNGVYHEPQEVSELFSRLIGKEVDKSFRLFPPFYADCGQNICVGKDVFINSGCSFQDQGGIDIGDNCFIGHNAVLATLNHGIAPDDRKSTYPAAIRLGKNVWLGSNVTILPGVCIGDNSIVAAGAVVTKDLPENCIAAGVPAKVIRQGLE